jgi:retinol dehydrogenase-12
LPWVVDKILVRSRPAPFLRGSQYFQGLILYEASYGALTQLYVGTSPETVNDNGNWFVPWARRGKIGAEAKDPKLGAELWAWIEEQRKSHT